MAITEVTHARSTESRGRGLHIGLWVVQGLLGVAFLLAGLGHLASPIEQVSAQNPWMTGTMGQFVRFIGAAEVLGGLGLILPAATRIKPSLTPLSALGLATVMVLAALTHAARGDFFMIVVNAVLGGMAAFVVWGRWRKAPIAPRS